MFCLGNQDDMCYHNLYLQKKFLEVIKKIEKVLSMWRWRNLTLAGKITNFRSVAFSKIFSISYLSYIPNKMIEKIEKIHKDFIWDSKKIKMKHSSMIGDYEEGGLKDIDFKAKFQSLHLSWIKRLSNNNFHPWKISLLRLCSSFIKLMYFTQTPFLKNPLTFRSSLGT